MNEAKEAVRSLLTTMAAAIVPDITAIAVDTEERGDVVLFTVHCNPADARFIIGKGGSNADGLKAIARAAGQKLGIKADVKLDVPPREKPVTSAPTSPAPTAA